MGLGWFGLSFLVIVRSVEMIDGDWDLVPVASRNEFSSRKHR
jgi:hypothetical protein